MPAISSGLPRPAQQALEEIGAPAGQRDGVFGIPESSTLTSAASGRSARLASAAESFASAALPGAPAQALPAEERPDLVVDRPRRCGAREAPTRTSGPTELVWPRAARRFRSAVSTSEAVAC
jgi:hypothetical protein